jgi:predicted nucleic acid-binding protein
VHFCRHLCRADLRCRRFQFQAGQPPSNIEDFVRHLDVMDWDTEAADQYGVIRAELEAAGTPIGAMDMMIAAHAKSIKAVLVTNNQKHYTKVKSRQLGLIQ